MAPSGSGTVPASAVKLASSGDFQKAFAEIAKRNPVWRPLITRARGHIRHNLKKDSSVRPAVPCQPVHGSRRYQEHRIEESHLVWIINRNEVPESWIVSYPLIGDNKAERQVGATPTVTKGI
jgi:hypothetical protein